MNRTGKRRLLKLADMLETDARNKKGVTFNLATVVAKTSEDGSGYSPYAEFNPEPTCGTTACAMGLAAISGEFKRAGLSYTFSKKHGFIVTTWNGRFKEYDDAAVKLFSITKAEANYLFTPMCYQDKSAGWGGLITSTVEGAAGERRVARRIRKLVAGKVDTTDVTI
jgi:hypothetical protein